MKDYRVHFSFYSEEYGEFDEVSYKVSAEDPFEARRMAWELWDKDDETVFRSCGKQCGVTWDASPLEMTDYFRAQTAYEKYNLRKTINVDVTNAAIKGDNDAARGAEREKTFTLGCLDGIGTIARDFGKPHGVEPPTVYEEIEYAWRMVNKFDEMRQHEKAEALADRINMASKWDIGSMHDLSYMFEHGGVTLNGRYEDISDHFGRGGVYPELADVDEREYPYIWRWTGARHIEKLEQLPMFGENDIIKGSDKMSFDCRTLVLRQDALTDKYRRPENMIWTPHYEDGGDYNKLAHADPDTTFDAVNMITGKIATLKVKDFWGVLRPEFAENIEFDNLKKQYEAQHATAVESPEADEEDWEMGDD